MSHCTDCGKKLIRISVLTRENKALRDALISARNCIVYCRRAHKDIQSDSGGVPVEYFIDAALALRQEKP